MKIKVVFKLYKQARKLGRCNSYLRNLITIPTDPLTLSHLKISQGLIHSVPHHDLSGVQVPRDGGLEKWNQPSGTYCSTNVQITPAIKQRFSQVLKSNLSICPALHPRYHLQSDRTGGGRLAGEPGEADCSEAKPDA